jgi:hypothetical protein
MKNILSSYFLIMCFLTSAFAGESFDIGSKMPENAKDTGVLLMTSPSQFRKAYEIEIDRIKFTICPDERGQIAHIVTKSLDFRTAEGIKIGDTYKTVQKITDRSSAKWRGWAFVVPLNSGWKAAFIQGETMTEGELQENSKVIFIFKGNS